MTKYCCTKSEMLYNECITDALRKIYNAV